MSKEDFIKFYFEYKNRHGFVSFQDVKNHFDVRFDETWRIYRSSKPCVLDAHGPNYLKLVTTKDKLDAEILLARIYSKLGFTSCQNFPIHESVYNNAFYVASTNIRTNDAVEGFNFDGVIFENYTNYFARKNQLENGNDRLTGRFTGKAITDLLKLRLVDTAAFNTDRHLGNFFYSLQTQDNGQKVATGIKTFDYGESGKSYNRDCPDKVDYYNNFTTLGDRDRTLRLSRPEIIHQFRTNETSQLFLPKEECAQILGSVNFQKEARELEQETHYKVDKCFVDDLDRSFTDMAEELAK